MKIMRYWSSRLIVFLAFMALSCNAIPAGEIGVKMKMVSTEKCAIELSEVYVSNIYGRAAAEKQKPYVAVDEGDFWRVRGQPPELQLGGNFEIVISKADGQVLKLTHSR
jgi:hypothetical protein